MIAINPAFSEEEVRTPSKIHFWFNTKKPRSLPQRSQQQAIGRMLAMADDPKSIQRLRRLLDSPNTQWHHLDCDRANGHYMNLFLCVDEQQHNKLHLQLQQMSTELIRSGIIGFDWLKRKYFVANDYLADHIRAWRKNAKPAQYVHLNAVKPAV